MKRTKTSKQWMMEHIHDVYVQRAKAEGYRSRAAYKLQQLAERDNATSLIGCFDADPVANQLLQHWQTHLIRTLSPIRTRSKGQ